MAALLLHFVYGLTDPRLRGDEAVRYVGVTLNPNARFQQHLSCTPNGPTQKNVWIQDLQKEGLEPGMEIFDTFKAVKDDRKLVLEHETHWIQHYLHLGAKLLNIQKNASGTKSMTIELPLQSSVESPSSHHEEPDFFSLAQTFDDQALQQKLKELEVKEIFEDGTLVYDIDFDVFFYLFMKQGAIGTFD